MANVFAGGDLTATRRAFFNDLLHGDFTAADIAVGIGVINQIQRIILNELEHFAAGLDFMSVIDANPSFRNELQSLLNQIKGKSSDGTDHQRLNKVLSYFKDHGYLTLANAEREIYRMQTFDSHLFRLYKEGRISLEEALKNADSPNNMKVKVNLMQDLPGQDNEANREAKESELNSLMLEPILEEEEDDDSVEGETELEALIRRQAQQREKVES